jgi:hypothetical protein
LWCLDCLKFRLGILVCLVYSVNFFSVLYLFQLSATKAHVALIEHTFEAKYNTTMSTNNQSPVNPLQMFRNFKKAAIEQRNSPVQQEPTSSSSTRTPCPPADPVVIANVPVTQHSTPKTTTILKRKSTSMSPSIKRVHFADGEIAC